MTVKKRFKHVVKVCLDGNLNPVTIIIHVSKVELLKFLDRIIPDDEEEKL